MYEQKKKTLDRLIELEKLGLINLYFTDETAFKLTPNVPYGWSAVGQQLAIRSSSEKVANMFGLLSYRGILKTFSTKENIDSQFIIECVDDVAQKLERETVMVFDNAPWHTSKKFKKKLEQWEQMGLYVFYLPTYSPHLNPIETLWRKMKLEWLKPTDYESAARLKQAIFDIVKGYNNEYIIDFSKAK